MSTLQHTSTGKPQLRPRHPSLQACASNVAPARSRAPKTSAVVVTVAAPLSVETERSVASVCVVVTVAAPLSRPQKPQKLQQRKPAVFLAFLVSVALLTLLHRNQD
jgi:hypothetical protein